jgi:hypothetical protein
VLQIGFVNFGQGDDKAAGVIESQPVLFGKSRLNVLTQGREQVGLADRVEMRIQVFGMVELHDD